MANNNEFRLYEKHTASIIRVGIDIISILLLRWVPPGNTI